jgi:DNA-binding XRE family transcriptional regulator
MNTKHYENIFNEFKMQHPYMADEIVDYGPRGELGIRLKSKDGTRYDYHATSKTVKRVEARPVYDFEDLSEERWRTLFSDRLNELMGIKGYTQQTLADYTGLGKGTINNYVNKKATPSAYALSRIARVLNCSIMDLTD